TLARNFQRTRSSMYRVLNEIRAQRLMDRRIEFLANPLFDDPDLESDMLGPMPEQEAFEEARAAMRIPKDVPPELSSLYSMPLLTKPQEQHLFRKMNFLKHKAARLLDTMKT